MPDKKINEIINKLNKKISEIFSSFSGSYLYGSVAKGTYNEDSDIDIIFMFTRILGYEEERLLAKIIGIIEAENDVFLDYHPYTAQNLKKNPIFYNEVVEKGIFYETA